MRDQGPGNRRNEAFGKRSSFVVCVISKIHREYGSSQTRPMARGMAHASWHDVPHRLGPFSRLLAPALVSAIDRVEDKARGRINDRCRDSSKDLEKSARAATRGGK